VERLIRALDNCKILDPACGSGAFPMGILQKMVHILFKIDPKNTEWKQRQIVRVEAAISQLEELDDAQYREQSIQDLNAQIKDIEEAFANNELDYGRKLYLIENCIYGVDIQSIATQISKLRFFISLVVDQRVDPSKDNFGIRPLPNLETKFVAANTLIGIEKPKAQLNLFDTPEIKKLEADLKKVRHRLFSSKSPSHKRKLREQDKALREQIAVVLQRNDWGTDTASQLANWDPYNQNVSSPFFDPLWMFDIKDGFDIVIGNPPYGGKLSKQQVDYFRKTFILKTSETAILFIEKGKSFIKHNGLLTYIVPKSYSFASNYAATRNFTIQELTLTVDCGKAFENVLLEAMVFLLKNNQKQKFYQSVLFDGRDFLEVSTVDKSLVEYFGFVLNGITEEEIAIAFKMTRTRKFLNDIASNTRGEAFQKFIEEDGDFAVIGGAEISEYGIRGVKGYISEQNIFSEKGYIRKNSLLSQNIVAHIKNPVEHIKITACIAKTTEFLITDTVNQILITDKSYSQELIWAILKSTLMNWFAYRFIFGKAIRTMHFDSPITSRIPIPEITEKEQDTIIIFVEYILYLNDILKDIPSYGKEVKEISKNKVITQYFEKIIDAIVFELYFYDHMKEKEIDIFQFIQRDIEEVMQGKVFENLDDMAKQKVIEQLYAKWTDPDNEVRDRIKLFAVRSPDILKPILESK
jgi:tRNA1(Val) A37 N6-methylase TrmN6